MRFRQALRTEGPLHRETGGDVMGGSTLMTVAMIVMMVVMMGGMLVGAGWAFLRRRRQRDR